MFNIKYIDLFSGVGGFHLGLTKAGHECVAYSEINLPAKKSYQAIHDPNNELAYYPDVTKFTNEQAKQFEDVDIIAAGFPCFEKGTLITTSEGYKNIEDIQKGDKVLTHTNAFKEVVLPMRKHKKGIYNLKIQGSPLTRVTEEHPYYVREKEYVWENVRRRNVRVWSEPKWVKAKDLIPNKHFVGFSQNNIKQNPYEITKKEAFLLGKYLAQGFIHNDDLQKPKVDSEKLITLSEKCGTELDDMEIKDFLLNLPLMLLEKMLIGYFSVIGSEKDGQYNTTSTSKKLIYSVGQVVQKVYHTPYSINVSERHLKETNSTRITYGITFSTRTRAQNRSKYLNGMLWNPVKEVVYDPDFDGDVYNFEVAEDNSYVANNATVHNCQSFSVGGKKLGMKDDRGLLFLEVVRLTEVIKPKYVIMENVKGLLSNRSTLDDEAGMIELLNTIQAFNQSESNKLTPQTKYSSFISNLSYYAEHLVGSEDTIDAFIKQDFVAEKLKKGVTTFECGTFNIIVNKFSEIGYNLEWRVFNSSDFGVSQSRERIYIVAHRREAETKPVLFSIGTHERIVDFRENKKTGEGEKHHIDVIPIINPGFRKKKINGRIFKEPNEDMYTITKIGNHGFLLVSKDEFPDGKKGEFSDKLHQMFELSDYNNCKDLYYTSRKITPLEAWQLMGYEEEQYNLASTVNPEYALYQQAGNSITPQIVYNIGRLLK